MLKALSVTIAQVFSLETFFPLVLSKHAEFGHDKTFLQLGCLPYWVPDLLCQTVLSNLLDLPIVLLFLVLSHLLNWFPNTEHCSIVTIKVLFPSWFVTLHSEKMSSPIHASQNASVCFSLQCPWCMDFPHLTPNSEVLGRTPGKITRVLWLWDPPKYHEKKLQ